MREMLMESMGREEQKPSLFWEDAQQPTHTLPPEPYPAFLTQLLPFLQEAFPGPLAWSSPFSNFIWKLFPTRASHGHDRVYSRLNILSLMVGDVSLLAVQMRSLRPRERQQLPQPFSQGQERSESPGASRQDFMLVLGYDHNLGDSGIPRCGLPTVAQWTLTSVLRG